MSYVIATPEMMATAAFDLARIGSQVSAASAVAAMPTTEVVAAGADEVSAGIAALFSAHAQEYQALSAQAAAFHDQFVHTLTAAARWYTATEIANAAAMRVVLGVPVGLVVAPAARAVTRGGLVMGALAAWVV